MTTKKNSKIMIEYEPTSGAQGALDVSSSKLGEAISEYSGRLIEDVKNSMGKMCPDEVTLEFGVTVKGESGFIIAKGSLQGHVKVQVKWKTR